MNTMFFAPAWFFGYDIALKVLFAVISLAVAHYAYKISRLTGKNQPRLFALSFGLFSFAYFSQAVFNTLMAKTLYAGSIDCMVSVVQSASFYDVIGMVLHMVLMTAGLALLTYMTFKVKKPRVFWLLLLLSGLAIFTSSQPLYMFYLLSTIYLLFLAWHFLDNYLLHKHKHTLIIAIAFAFLLFRSIHFVFSIEYELFYVIGRLAELGGYLLILWNFMSIKAVKRKR